MSAALLPFFGKCLDGGNLGGVGRPRMTQLNYRRGLLRIAGLWEFAVAVAAGIRIFEWISENPFARYVADYISIWRRLLPLVGWAAAPFVVVAGWLVMTWIARGFRPD